MPWGAVAGAVISAGAGYMENKKNQSSTNVAQSPETQGATNAALTQAQNIADRPYTPYGGQRVADLSQNEQQAVSQASPNSALEQQASSLMTAGANDITGIKQYNSDNLKPYMDPYVSSVLTPQLNAENISYSAQKSALENSKAGAFGGDRSALEEAGLERTHGENIQRDVGNAYSQAYTNAQTAFFADQQKQINAGNALEAAGGDIAKLNTQQIQDLMATGGLSRVLQQSQLDFNYQQFVENRDWSVNNLQPLLQTIGAAKGVNITSTYTPPASGVAGEAIGAAATIAGAYFTGGKSVNAGGSPGSSSGNGTVADNSTDVSTSRAQEGFLNAGNSGSTWTGDQGGGGDEFIP